MKRSLVLLLACAALAAQPPQPPPAAAPPKPEELCSIEGVVRNSATGEPLKKAAVQVYPVNRSGPFEPAPPATTDDAGRFSVKNLTAGQYRLSAMRPGFVRQEYGARRGGGFMSQGATLTLLPGQRLKDLEIRLQPHAVLTGRVLDEDGDPIMSAAVQLVRSVYMRGRRQMVPLSRGQSNDLGDYRLFGVPPGHYLLTVDYRGGMAFGGGQTVTETAAGDQGYAATYYPGTIDPAGAAWIEVPVNGRLQGLDVTLQRVRTYRISGRVLGAPAGRRDGMLMLMPRVPGGMAFFERNQTPWRGPQGSFTMRGVTPGSYTLVAHLWDEEQPLSARVPVDVTNTNLEDLNITLTAGADLSGLVRMEDGSPMNLEELNVYLQPREIAPMGGGSGRVKADGSFTLKHVSPELLEVGVSGLKENFYLKSARYSDADVLKDGLDLTRGVAGPLELVISPHGAQLDGAVTAADGRPASGAMVLLLPEQAGRREQLTKTLTTDQTGRYTITGITPGDYRLFALDDHERGAEADPDFLKRWGSAAEKVSLAERAKETRALKLIVTGEASATRAEP